MGKKKSPEETKKKQQEEVIEEDIVTLTLDGDETIDCSVIGIFEGANGKEYIALLPKEGKDADGDQVYLYRYLENEGEEPVLENILDDEEFEIASDAFDEMLDNMEFDELLED